MKTFNIFIKYLALQLGIKIEECTSDEQLNEFFKNIRPLTTNHKLIRLGGNSDGGYLIPDDLNGVEMCFSPGVSEIANFESDLAKLGIRSCLADYSVESPPIHNPLFKFDKKFLGMEENAVYTTLEKWVKGNISADQSDLILQMDIEGGEYDVIFDSSSDFLKIFRILVIEFHQLDSVLTKLGYQLINNSFTKLLRNFEIVHIHPNNYYKPVRYKTYEIPPVMEFTFLRKDRIYSSSPTLSFPHELDRSCVAANSEFPLPDCWYKKTS